MQPFTHKWKLFATSLLVGLLVSGFLLLALEEFHEEIAEPFLIHMDLQIQEAVHGYTSVALTRVMIGLTWVGSPQVLYPVVPLIAALFWWGRLQREAMIFFIAMGKSGDAEHHIEAAVSPSETGRGFRNRSALS
jgi:hypothetical protein